MEEIPDTSLGHNRGPRLMELVNQLIELEAEKAAVVNRIKALEAEAKAEDFDVKALKQAIKLITGTGDITATEEHRTVVGAYIATISERIGNEPPDLSEERINLDETIKRWQARAGELLKTGVR